MKPVRIHDKRRILDDFFKVDAATVSYEGFDGRTIGPVRRLSLERGDSVAALVVNRDRNTARSWPPSSDIRPSRKGRAG
jgi:hypothetical protein